VSWGLHDGPCGLGGTGPDVVGSRPDGASAEGVLDLAGSVAEWSASGADSAAEVRGGSWADGAASAIRSWARREVPASSRSTQIGFRCVYAVR
jgi:formylglycine-generating enzyme required for sulfatase activity